VHLNYAHTLALVRHILQKLLLWQARAYIRPIAIALAPVCSKVLDWCQSRAR
jgi:hypothetical protein